MNAMNKRTIEQERARSDALFTSIGDGALATDERGIIRRANRVALELLGHTKSELVGSWYPKAVVATDGHGATIAVMDRPITEVFFTGKPVSAKTFYLKKDGTELPLSSTVSPILLGGKPVGAIEVFRDISLELAIDKMKSEFIALASHQLRTPLSAISVYAHMLQDGYAGTLNDQQMEYVTRTVDATTRMQALINALLNISRIESGQLAYNPKRVVMQEVIEQVLDESKPATKQKKLRIIRRLPKLPLVIMSDCLMVKEIISNLVTNAIQYTPPNGHITISARQEKQTVVIAIRDTGIGIPLDHRSQLFSPFYRAENALEYFESGTGLGLYLVKLLIAILNGEISFTSQEGKGSTFFVTIPMRQPSPSNNYSHTGL